MLMMNVSCNPKKIFATKTIPRYRGYSWDKSSATFSLLAYEATNCTCVGQLSCEISSQHYTSKNVHQKNLWFESDKQSTERQIRTEKAKKVVLIGKTVAHCQSSIFSRSSHVYARDVEHIQRRIFRFEEILW